MAQPVNIIDSNVYLSRWPFRRLPGDEPQQLIGTLRKSGVTQAWAGSFDALLHNDVASVNQRLAADCRRWGDGLLVPIGAVNPKLPDWKEELRRCLVEHRMPGIRLHPNYHRYALDEPECRELLGMAAERKMLVQIAMVMEDDRTQHPLVRVPNVDVSRLAAIAGQTTGLRVQLLNTRAVTPVLVKDLAAAGVHTDFAMIEGVHGLKRLVQDASADRVVFGSYFPFYYWEAAALKVREAEADLSVMAATAKKLLGEMR